MSLTSTSQYLKRQQYKKKVNTKSNKKYKVVLLKFECFCSISTPPLTHSETWEELSGEFEIDPFGSGRNSAEMGLFQKKTGDKKFKKFKNFVIFRC